MLFRSDHDESPKYPVKKAPKLEEGQQKMHNFFAPKPASKAPTNAALAHSRALAVGQIQSGRPGRALIGTNATYSAPSIDPMLRQHRLVTGTLLPTRNSIRPPTPTETVNAYHMFSSSPQKPYQEDQENEVKEVAIIDLTDSHVESLAPPSRPVKFTDINTNGDEAYGSNRDHKRRAHEQTMYARGNFAAQRPKPATAQIGRAHV